MLMYVDRYGFYYAFEVLTLHMWLLTHISETTPKQGSLGELVLSLDQTSHIVELSVKKKNEKNGQRFCVYVYRPYQASW